MAILNCKHHTALVCTVEANIGEGDSSAAIIDLEYKIDWQLVHLVSKLHCLF